MAASGGRGPRIAVGVLSLALCAAAAECGLRIAGIEYPAFYEADPIAGARHIPDASGWQTLEGRAFVTINSQGRRDREHGLAKPAGTYRIAVIGDSFAEAMQVDARAAFWALLEDELATCAAMDGQHVEVLNFGVSGFGTAQELRVLEHKVLPYEPDLVVLPFVPNDVRNNHRDLERDPGRPYYRLEGETLVLDDSFLNSARYLEAGTRWSRSKAWIRGRSRIVQLLYEVRRIPERLAQRPTGGTIRDLGAFVPPRDDTWAEAWAVTEALVDRIARVTRDRGVDFLLVVVTDADQVNPDREFRRAAAKALDVADLHYYEDRVLAHAAAIGVDAVGLSDSFLEDAERTGECLHGFENARPCKGHWNERGHRLASEIVAESICKRVGALASS